MVKKSHPDCLIRIQVGCGSAPWHKIVNRWPLLLSVRVLRRPLADFIGSGFSHPIS